MIMYGYAHALRVVNMFYVMLWEELKEVLNGDI